MLSLANLLQRLTASALLFTPALTAQPNCPTMPFEPEQGVLVAQGYGFNQTEAERNARIELAQMLHGVEVFTQFQQQANNDNQTIFQQSHLASVGKVSGRHIHHNFNCEQGAVSYLVYDAGSLEKQLAALLASKRYVLSGPDYLINSPLLKPYQTNQGKTMSVQLIVTGEEYILQIGTHRLVVPANRIDDFVALSSVESSSQNKIPLRLETPFLDSHQHINLFVQATAPSVLFACQMEGCHILTPINSDAQRLELVNTQSGPLNTVYLALIRRSALYLPELSAFTPSTPGYFQQLLNLQHNHQSDVAIIALKTAGNFQR